MGGQEGRALRGWASERARAWPALWGRARRVDRQGGVKKLFCKDWNIDLTIFIASQKIKNFFASAAYGSEEISQTKFLYTCFDQILDLVL